MKLGWKGALGIVLSMVLLWWTLRSVHIDEVLDVLGRSSIALLTLSALVATIIFPLRAVRWKVILASVDADVPFGPLWRATAVGMMVNNVIPARVGELARAFALTRERPRISLPAAVASIGVDRVFDTVVLFGLMFGAMLSPAFPDVAVIGGRAVSNMALTATAGIGALLAALYTLALRPRWFAAVAEWLLGLFSESLAAKGHTAVLAFADGLNVLRSPRRFALVLWWTTLHWLCNAAAMWIGFRAVGMELPYSAALFLQGLIAIGVAVPSSPGFFGVFEWFAKVGLVQVYNAPESLAVTWAIGYHILSFIPITVIGAWYASRLGFSLRQLDGARQGEPQPPVAPRPAGRGT